MRDDAKPKGLLIMWHQKDMKRSKPMFGIYPCKACSTFILSLADPMLFLLQEAKSLGIPEYALPELGKEPTLEEAREAQKKIDSIVASFLSADI